MTRWRWTQVAAAFVLVVAGAARGDATEDAAAAMERGDFAAAVTMYEAITSAAPTDKFAVYNLACARAMNGETDAAAETLLNALSIGFVDLFHVERDAHLAPIRGDRRFRAIMEQWNRLLDARFDAEVAAVEAKFGEEYLFRRVPDLRVGFAAAVDPRDLDAALEEADRVWVFAETILPAKSPDPDRQDPWVHVILPTPRDFMRLVGAVHIGGYYDRDDKRLVSRDLGPSLRHELFHVAHWRHMDRIGQHHAIWIQEGLASLVEDVDIDADGTMILRPSWRTNIAKRLAVGNRLMPLEQLASMERDRFASTRPRAMYAQARTWMLFLHDRGVLRKWYEMYVDGFDEDPTGARSVALALGIEPDRVDREFRAWVRELETVGDIARPGSASLGLALSQGTGAGPKVDELVGTRPPGVGGEGENRLRYRDVILSIDDRPVRTLDDLHRVMGEYEVGDRVRVRVRRGTTEREFEVSLVEYDPDTGR